MSQSGEGAEATTTSDKDTLTDRETVRTIATVGSKPFAVGIDQGKHNTVTNNIASATAMSTSDSSRSHKALAPVLLLPI